VIEPRLLIVDDQAPIRYALREFFAAVGWDVDCAGSFDEAATALAAREYGAVIADLRLDERHATGGLDVVRIARECSATASIVVLTAYGSPAAAAEARRRGADALLDKPVPLAELARVIDRTRRARCVRSARA
jgi:two-component system response regulator PilR (NtrC family)